jgi:hypothetical protein
MLLGIDQGKQGLLQSTGGTFCKAFTPVAMHNHQETGIKRRQRINRI